MTGNKKTILLFLAVFIVAVATTMAAWPDQSQKGSVLTTEQKGDSTPSLHKVHHAVDDGMYSFSSATTRGKTSPS